MDYAVDLLKELIKEIDNELYHYSGNYSDNRLTTIRNRRDSLELALDCLEGK